MLLTLSDLQASQCSASMIASLSKVDRFNAIHVGSRCETRLVLSNVELLVEENVQCIKFVTETVIGTSFMRIDIDDLGTVGVNVSNITKRINPQLCKYRIISLGLIFQTRTPISWKIICYCPQETAVVLSI